MEDRRATESTLGTHDPSEMPHKHDCAFEDPPQSPGEILENNPQKELLPYPEYPEVVTEAQPVWTANNGPYGTAAKGDELPIVYTQQQERNTNQMPVSSLSEAPRLSQRAFWAIIAIIIVALLSVGLGVGLGVGLRHANGGGTAAPSTSPTASPPLEMGTCNQGIKYCGWVLIPSMGYSASYLTSVGSKDPSNDLFLCGVNNDLILRGICGGPYTCEPPTYSGGGCDSVTNQSCCQ